MSETSLDEDILRVKRYLRAGLASKGDIIAVLNRVLKEMEPIAPHDYDPVIYGHRYTCGKCHYSLWRNDNYCSQCGKKVKWQ